MSRPRTARLHLLPIVLLALVLRLAVVWIVARAHSAGWFFGQATELASLAESLRSGHGFSSPFGGHTGPSAFLAPGYPLIVAVVFAIFHPYSQAAAVALMCLQACFGAATVCILMLLSHRAFDSPTANIAGAIWAMAPPLLFLPTLFWETSLSILLATSILSLAHVSADRPTLHSWLSAGLLGACSLAINPALLPLLVCCFGWSFYRNASQSRIAPSLGLVLCLILSTPWTVRNYRQLHSFVPLRDNFGYELWQGNRVGGEGFFMPDLHPNTNIKEFTLLHSLGEIAYMHDKGAVATRTIHAHPARFASLTLHRIFYFWTGIGRDPSSLVVTYICTTTLLGFSGLLLLCRNKRQTTLLFALPLLLFPMPYYITHPDFRFRLVLDPLLTALAAHALSKLLARANEHPV